MELNLSKKQFEVYECWNNEKIDTIIYSGNKGAGKRYIAIKLLLLDASTIPNSRLFIATKYMRSLFKYTHERIGNELEVLGIENECSFDYLNECFNFKNGSKIQYVDISYKRKDPYYNRLEYMCFDKGWIIEADSIETNYGEGIYEERAIQKLYFSIRNSKNRKIIHTCRPCSNYIKNDYYLKYIDGSLKDNVSFIICNLSDCTYINQDMIDIMSNNVKDGKICKIHMGSWDCCI